MVGKHLFVRLRRTIRKQSRFWIGCEIFGIAIENELAPLLAFLGVHVCGEELRVVCQKRVGECTTQRNEVFDTEVPLQRLNDELGMHRFSWINYDAEVSQWVIHLLA